MQIKNDCLLSAVRNAKANIRQFLLYVDKTLHGRRRAGAANIHTSATLSLGGILTFDNNTASNDGGECTLS